MAAAVAVAVLGASLAEGGYPASARAAIALVAWTAVVAGLLAGTLPRARLPGTALAAAAFLGVLALLAGLSAVWTSDAGIAIQEGLRVSTYLGLFALVVSTTRQGEARGWLVGIALGATAVAVVAILSRTVPSLPGGDEEITELLPAAQGRLSFPIGYWNGLAALLAIGTVLLVWLGASARSIAGRALAVGAIPALGLAIYLTSSRGSFAALAIGLAGLVAIGPRRPALIASAALGGIGAGLAIALASGQGELLDAATGPGAATEGVELLGATLACVAFSAAVRAVADEGILRLVMPRRAALAGLAVLAVACIAAVALADPSERFDEFKEPPPSPEAAGDRFVAAHLESGSGSGRWQFWSEAADAYGSEPLHGIGAGGFGTYWTRHATTDQSTTQVHNLYLELLSELGPGGLAALLGFLAAGIAGGIRGRSAFPAETAAALSILAAGAVSASVDWTWEIPVVFGPVVIAVGLLTGPALAVAHTPRSERREGRMTGWGAAAIAVGAVTIVLAGDTLLASRSLEASRDAAADGNLVASRERADTAAALQPWAAEPRLQAALVDESAGDLDAASESIAEAIERAPDDWALRLVQARIATLDGDVASARRALAEARRLYPRAPVFRALDGPLREDAP